MGAVGINRGTAIGLAIAAFVVGGLGGCVAGCTFGVVTSPSASETRTVTSTVRAPAVAAPPTTVAPPPPSPSGPATTIGEGTYAVGVDILPGTYRTTGPSAGSRQCYYKRLASFESSDIIDNEGSQGPQVVTIAPTDAAFSTNGCEPWTLA